jgi:hypothetical protein
LKANRKGFTVTGGNNDFEEWYKSHYYFSVRNGVETVELGELPYGVSNHQMVDVHGNTMFLIGGVTDEVPSTMPQSPYDLKKTEKAHGIILPYILISVRNSPFVPINGAFITPRCDFQCVLNRHKVIIFGGIGANGKASTAIEIFDTKTFQVTKAEYRLPLGVSGCRLAWHGDDVLLIGGERLDKRSNGVVKIDFKEKNILSLRDMHKKRAGAIILDVSHDEIIALGGDREKTAELRSWNRYLGDYSWTDCTKKIKNLDFIGKPTEYISAEPTFVINAADDDNFPIFKTSSNFIFGNELMPFMMEITQNHMVKFYPAPLKFQ